MLSHVCASVDFSGALCRLLKRILLILLILVLLIQWWDLGVRFQVTTKTNSPFSWSSLICSSISFTTVAAVRLRTRLERWK